MNWIAIFGKFCLKSPLIVYSNKNIIFNSSYWRALITIACNMHRNRELRDLFVDLCEKLIEPWRQNSWNREQVNKFLSAITQSVLDLEISRDQETRCLWDRYMQAISICLDKMYHI